MTAKALLLAATLLTVVAVPATAQNNAASAPAAAAPAQNEAGARLRALFHESDEANLRRNPISALFRGDFRYADRLGDYMSDAYYAAERAAAEQELAALHRIDRNQLNPTDRADLVAQAEYGGPITAIVAHDTYAGTQFHPEKSQRLGLALIANFLKWKP